MRPTVQELKGWYQDLTVLLNRLEGAGERLDLYDSEHGKVIEGQTGKVSRNANAPGTWGRT